MDPQNTLQSQSLTKSTSHGSRLGLHHFLAAFELSELPGILQKFAEFFHSPQGWIVLILVVALLLPELQALFATSRERRAFLLGVVVGCALMLT